MKPLSKKELAEMYRLMRRVHRLKASLKEAHRYMALSRRDSLTRFAA